MFAWRLCVGIEMFSIYHLEAPLKYRVPVSQSLATKSESIAYSIIRTRHPKLRANTTILRQWLFVKALHYSDDPPVDSSDTSK
ncbi:hypothetical protein TNCV_2794101 [Trichonephila clavipes]|nr:hypothetical protein TNCV_2794101 [Trichonephila clavipes]